MQRKLKEIAEIQPGHSFRGRIEEAADGTLQVIQIKDIGLYGSIVTNDLIRVRTESIKPDFFVQPGDVLFTTRGTSRRAAAVRDEMPRTIYVAQIFAMKSIDRAVLPEYLAWYLNQVPAQEYFEMYSSGALIQNVRKDVLADLPVEVPSLETQQRVLKIADLRTREKELIKKIQSHRGILIDDALMNAIRCS